jgi:hypothetical protein
MQSSRGFEAVGAQAEEATSSDCVVAVLAAVDQGVSCASSFDVAFGGAHRLLDRFSCWVDMAIIFAMAACAKVCVPRTADDMPRGG